MIEIVAEPIDAATVLQRVNDPDCGANLLFCGTTRRLTGNKQTAKLVYECYREMAIRQLETLAEEAKNKWSVKHVAIVHRIGEVGIGESSVVIAVSSPHRAEAFAAGKWLLDELKIRVPVWKQEHWADGTNEWQHPENHPTGIAEDSS